MDLLGEALELLVKVLREQSYRSVFEFETYLSENHKELESLLAKDAFEILKDLEWDLAFFVPDPVWRLGDPAYYGPDKLRNKISAAFQQLTLSGVAVPQLPDS